MLRGIIKFYSERRGYGFIRYSGPESSASPGSGGDVYVHYSQIDDPGALCEGQMVTFDIKNGDRGPEAVNVQLAI